MTTTTAISYRCEQRVAYITLDRAPANAYNLHFMHALHAAVVKADTDPEVGAVIVRSASERFFCAGADIKEFQRNDTASNKLLVAQASATTTAMEASGKLFIAQIAGHALGGGLELAMACDVRFAAEGNFLLGLPEIKLGLIPGNGGSQRLVRLIGLSRALELLATGASFDAVSAANWGLINQLYPKSELAERCFDFAKKVAAGPPLAIAASKRAVRDGFERTLNEGLQLEQALCEPLYDSNDAREGFSAFVEKRPPIFTGS